MGKKKVAKVCIVVDASIAGAAGSMESQHPNGVRCRTFLVTLRNVSHRMAWTAAIKAEWDRHQSAFAIEWLEHMESLGKLHRLVVEEDDDLRNDLIENCDQSTVIPYVLKDCHLIEAAFATDCRIASWDELARRHFSRLAAKVKSLKAIQWVNPVVESERASLWLQQGAPAQKKRFLKS